MDVVGTRGRSLRKKWGCQDSRPQRGDPQVRLHPNVKLTPRRAPDAGDLRTACSLLDVPLEEQHGRRILVGETLV